ncbi:copper chaperone PCu(A)C [Thauera sp. WH-1]|uniref:copper chaperone PCu(A)C n=1 Tax=Thauera sp. WH-1 TaxID=3398230 RepID=UPI0039FC04A3
MKKLAIATLFALSSLHATAEVTVSEAWVRATVPQQRATGAFMQLKSDADARLVSADSPVAGVVEIHEMVMDKDVMKMSRIEALELPAGQAVELKPGGYHVMLMDLKAQVKEGDQVPLTIVIENKDGSQQSIELVAPARPLNAPMKMQHGKH